jgi:hypothetical protein
MRLLPRSAVRRLRAKQVCKFGSQSGPTGLEYPSHIRRYVSLGPPASWLFELRQPTLVPKMAEELYPCMFDASS